MPWRPPEIIQPSAGALDGGLRQHIADGFAPGRQQLGGVGGDADRDHLAVYVVELEHLTGEHPDVVDRTLHAPMALGRPIAKADHPFGAVAQVIGAFLTGLRGNAR